jgi:uncharacterized membrane protein
MDMQVKHISHKLIDSLSDGVFSIALTLLGLNVVGLATDIGRSDNPNSEVLKNWPTFLAYTLGFLVLYSMWYSYHAFSQYTKGTNAFVVWNHGAQFFFVALMPFGVAFLANTLNTPNRKWGLFYFGLCLFGYNFVTVIQWALNGFKFQVEFTDEMPMPHERLKRGMPIYFMLTSATGLIVLVISLVNPWVAFGFYVVHILLSATPIRSFNKMIPMIDRRIK